MSHPAERCRVPAKLGVPAGLIWFESRMELRSCFRSHRRDLWAGTVRWKRIRHWPGADAAPKAAVRRSYQLWVLNHVLKMFYLFIFLKNVFHLQLVGSECNGNTSGQEREREMNEMNIMDLERSNCIDSGCWEFRLEGHRGFSIQFDLTQKSVRVLESWKWAIKSRKESCRIFTNVVNASIHLPEFEFFFFFQIPKESFRTFEICFDTSEKSHQESFRILENVAGSVKDPKESFTGFGLQNFQDHNSDAIPFSRWKKT